MPASARFKTFWMLAAEKFRDLAMDPVSVIKLGRILPAWPGRFVTKSAQQFTAAIVRQLA